MKGRVEKDKCHNGQYYKGIILKRGKLIAKIIGKILKKYLCYLLSQMQLTFTEVLSLIKAQILEL